MTLPTPHVTSDGTTYVHGHLVDSVPSLVALFAPFTGRTMLAHAFDRGAVKPTRLTLHGFSGERADITVHATGQRLYTPVWDLLGQRCTMVDPV